MKFSKVALLFALIFSFNLALVRAEELRVPIMVGQTGASATFGKGELDAYTLATEEWNARGGVNGKKVVLEVEDTQTSQQKIVTAFHRFALNRPTAIVGPTWLDGFQAVIPLARKQQVLLLTPSAAREAFSVENSSWPITFYHNSTIEIKTLLEYLKDKGYERIALVYEQEPFAEMVRELVAKNVSNLVADIGVQGGTESFQSVVTNLRNKKPDVLIVFVWDERSLLTLQQQIRIQLPQLPLATVHDGEGWLQNPAFSANLPHLIHTKFVIADSTFGKRFEKRFGYQPMLTASNAYDTLNALLSAHAAGKSSAKDIREYLLTQPLETVTFGKFTFNADGSVPSKVTVVDFSAKGS